MIGLYSLYGTLKVAEADSSIRDKCALIEKNAGMTFEEAVLNEKDVQTRLALVGLMVMKNASTVLDMFPEIDKCACEGFYDGLVKIAQVQTPTQTQWWQTPGQPPPASSPFIGASGWLQNKFSKMYGGGLKGDLGGALTSGLLYFIPGVGTVISGIDAIADIGNIFRSGATWKQRLGSGVSALANLGWAALGLIPGLSGMSGIKGLKPIARMARGIGASPVGKFLTGATKWQKSMQSIAAAKGLKNPIGLGAKFLGSPKAQLTVGMIGGGLMSGADPHAVGSKAVGLNLPTATRGAWEVR